MSHETTERVRAEPRGSGPVDGSSVAGESDDDRHNRQLMELANELRVALPGVQMLFGFLLALPFTQRFASVSESQRRVYFATFLVAAAASVCLIAPATFHRIVWRRHRKRQLLHISNSLAIAGTVFLAAAIAGSVGLIASTLFGTAWAALAFGLTTGVTAGVWFVLPVMYRRPESRKPTAG
jgi:Family of unknown function (DUF6328)